MYIFKNAYINITRYPGRNLVVGIIITCITISACIALAINKSGTNLIESHKENNPVEVTFSLQRNKNFNATQSTSTDTTIDKMTVSDIKKYADTDLVTSYYYTLESTLSSSSVTPISDNEISDESETDPSNSQGMKTDMGDFRLTAYSDSSYISEFTEGTKKMTTGSMFTIPDTDDSVIISETLAEQNDLKVGDEITFNNTSDDAVTYTFKITGLYSDNTDTEENSFMKMNAMNSSNQIYTTISAMEKVLNKIEDSLGSDQGLTAKFYLEKLANVEAFTKEVTSKGLDTSYTARTNEQVLLESLSPIEQISKFSSVFVIVVLIVGALILSVINLLHIRERKYEIGVLRSIGMSKWKVSLQIITEIFLVAMISLIIGTGIGAATSQPVADYLLKGQIENNENASQTATENFGSENFNGGPGRMQKEERFTSENIDYIDHLNVKIDPFTILKLFACGIVLVVTSSFIILMNINKYEPNKMLQTRN